MNIERWAGNHPCKVPTWHSAARMVVARVGAPTKIESADETSVTSSGNRS